MSASGLFYKEINVNDAGETVTSDEMCMVPLKAVEVRATLEGALAIVDLNLTYTNPRDTPIECTYEFPLEAQTILSQLQVKVDDKIIEAIVDEKEKAKQKYEDVIAKGNMGILAERKTVG